MCGEYNWIQLTVKHTRNKIKYNYFILVTVSKELNVSAQESHHQAYKYGTSKMNSQKTHLASIEKISLLINCRLCESYESKISSLHTLKKMQSSIIDKHQHMHFFTFNSILVRNVNFNVKIHKNT